jgi:hypothetical protein
MIFSHALKDSAATPFIYSLAQLLHTFISMEKGIA